MRFNVAPSTRIADLPVEQRLWLEGLTRREAEAAIWAAHGLLVREIACKMQVSEGTVKTLLQRAHNKLGCQHVRELMAILFRMCFEMFHPDDCHDSGISRQPSVDNKSTKGG